MKTESRDYALFMGRTVEEFTVTNSQGMSFKAISYGATLTDVIMKDRSGKSGSILLGMDGLDGYMSQTFYLGASIGPFGNRISMAQFDLNGETIKLTQNNGTNNLHSGPYGFNSILWDGKAFTEGDTAGVRFTRDLADGEDGFPGNRKVAVTISLNEKNELEFFYQGESDRDTPMNFTNHGYWNLSGTLSSTEDHQLQIPASHYLPVDERLIPTGELKPVAEGPMDFRKGKLISKDIDAEPVGFDHNFCLDGEGFHLAARAEHRASGRVMEVWTDLPGVQFFAGKPLGGFDIRGGKAGRCAGFCLETQYFPDCVNQHQFASCIKKAGEKMETRTLHKFYLED